MTTNREPSLRQMLEDVRTQSPRIEDRPAGEVEYDRDLVERWRFLSAQGDGHDMCANRNTVSKLIKVIDALASATPAMGVPKGWVMVPREPTNDMKIAATNVPRELPVIGSTCVGENWAADIYREMISRALNPPLPTDLIARDATSNSSATPSAEQDITELVCIPGSVCPTCKQALHVTPSAAVGEGVPVAKVISRLPKQTPEVSWFDAYPPVGALLYTTPTKPGQWEQAVVEEAKLAGVAIEYQEPKQVLREIIDWHVQWACDKQERQHAETIRELNKPGHMVVPDEITDVGPYTRPDITPAIAYASGWNACRSAVINAQKDNHHPKVSEKEQADDGSYEEWLGHQCDRGVRHD